MRLPWSQPQKVRVWSDHQRVQWVCFHCGRLMRFVWRDVVPALLMVAVVGWLTLQALKVLL
ncbi:MAG: hypothetical protein JRF07_02900 [Deltaproteobacteria bacterium]|nr:hypothetical protein [Deltaproteobacteria bacterium]